MSGLKAGFARLDITPMLGISMSGYYETRFAEGTRDPLELSALAVSCGDTTALLISQDCLQVPRPIIEEFKESIIKATGLPSDCIYIHATHIHTGPSIILRSEDAPSPLSDESMALIAEYRRFLAHKMADVAVTALKDLKPARMGWAVGKAPNVAFIRRFRMKDGSVRTNPGINNPDILAPMAEIDDRVNVLRFDREGGETLVLVNFGNHPDVVGGSKFSADWPGFLRRTTEQALPECKCIVFNGCQGDVNHINTCPKDTDRPLVYTPDRNTNYEFSRYMGRAMAGTVLQEYDKVKYVEVDSIRCLQKDILIPANKGTAEELVEAHRLYDLYVSGDEEELEKLRQIYPDMQYTTVIAGARRMVKLEDKPDFFEMNISAVAIGSVALIGLPGEPFTGIGVGLKEAQGWDVILPSCLVNGSNGYFPMMDSYQEGGYEASASNFKAGAAEQMIEEGVAILNQLVK